MRRDREKDDARAEHGDAREEAEELDPEEADGHAQADGELDVLPLVLVLGVFEGEAGLDVLLAGDQDGDRQQEVGDEGQEPRGYQAAGV